MENPTQRIRGRCFLPTLRLPVTSQAWPYSPEDPLASQKGLKRDNDIWCPRPICQTRPRHSAQQSLAPSMLSLLCLSFFTCPVGYSAVPQGYMGSKQTRDLISNTQTASHHSCCYFQRKLQEPQEPLLPVQAALEGRVSSLPVPNPFSAVGGPSVHRDKPGGAWG